MKKTLTKEDLINTVEAILDIPPHTGRRGPGFTIVTAILETLTKALQDGDEIEIKGLGTLRPVKRKAYSHSVSYFHGQSSKAHTRLKVLVPPKTKIIFTPSKSILTTLNEEPSK